MNIMNARVGSGFDVHRLVKGRPLIIGGVKIEHETGLEGHSDADVLVHAVMDALLGAAGLPDIGQLFPDNDPNFKGADSLALLRQVNREMKLNIARALNIEPERIGIKATTTEHLGFTGRKEGIAASACALIIKKDN